jgi:hypothetical protein
MKISKTFYRFWENLAQVIISDFLEVGLVKAEILSDNDVVKKKF